MRWLTRVVTARLGLLVTVAAGLIAAASGVRTVGVAVGWITAPGSEVANGMEWAVLSVFLVTVSLGELNRITLPGLRDSAPMSVAASLALAMTFAVLGTPVAFDATATICVTALGMLLPALLSGGMTERQYTDVSSRLLSAAVAAALFRSVPFVDGRTLLDLQPSWESRRWMTAIAMVLVSVSALVVQSLVTATVVASEDHVPWRVALLDELRQVLGLSTALAASGTLIALAEPPLGILAIPIFLIPLVLTQFAVRRYAGIRRTYLQTIRTLSRLTEVGGYTPAAHPSRVADLSVAMARTLGVQARDVVTLEYAALLHDIGQLALQVPIPGGATVLAAPADQERIAADGAQIVRRTGVLDEVADILEVQSRAYRHVRELGEKIPLAARVIKVANAYDDLVGDPPTITSRDAAIERIQLGLGYEYDPIVVDALERVLRLRAQSVDGAGGAPTADPDPTELAAR